MGSPGLSQRAEASRDVREAAGQARDRPGPGPPPASLHRCPCRRRWPGVGGLRRTAGRRRCPGRRARRRGPGPRAVTRQRRPGQGTCLGRGSRAGFAEAVGRRGLRSPLHRPSLILPGGEGTPSRAGGCRPGQCDGDDLIMPKAATSTAATCSTKPAAISSSSSAAAAANASPSGGVCTSQARSSTGTQPNSRRMSAVLRVDGTCPAPRRRRNFSGSWPSRRRPPPVAP